MKRLRILGCAALLAGAAACSDPAPRTTGIIPAPRETTWLEGSFALPATLRYTTQFEPADAAELETWAAGRFDLPPAAAEAEAQLRLVQDPAVAAEGYRLRVDRRGIEIAAADAAGIFYGMQSLLEMADRFGGRIPAVEIADAPRFAWRGLMFDVSRHFRTKEFVMKQLDLMARHKLNRMHWHLTDAAGWRIAIDRYPELTEIAAWRPYPDWAAWSRGGARYCRRDDPEAHGGFYTKDDIREVVEYARQRHIEVIPEIEMPSHSEEVLAVYPALSCTGEPYTSSDFCVGSEATFEFLENVLDEVIGLFPSEYVHIGGDEAPKTHWRTCPKCRERMRREGLKDVDELQSYLVRRIERYLNARGRRLIGWDEILEGGLAPDATVMSWRGVEGGIAAARSGHQAVMTPGSHCYLDHCQDDPSVEPPSAASFVSLADVYGYDPAPDSLGTDVQRMILGVQGNLWCEHVVTDDHFEHMLWPRGLAIAEVGWSDREKMDYDDFHARVLDAVERMRGAGYHPFDQKSAVGSRPESREAVECLSTGKPVTYLTAYNAGYAAAGDATMTDGLRGGWKFGDKRWQGWLNRDVDLVVDLGERQTIAYVGVDFIQAPAAEIYMPGSVELSLSDDNEHFTALATVAVDETLDPRKTAFQTFAWQGEAAGRYVRVTARIDTARGGWLFTDEAIVR